MCVGECRFYFWDNVKALVVWPVFLCTIQFQHEKKKRLQISSLLNLFTLYEASLTTCTVNLEVMSSIIDVCMLFFGGVCVHVICHKISQVTLPF